MKRVLGFAVGLTVVLACLGQVSAALVTPGFTFAVASGSNHSTGTHYHSNTGGVYGNPAGKAEVGSYSSEEVRGLSEYNLTGLVSGPAFVTFGVFKAGGLFTGTNDFPFVGNINVVAYQGNNLEDISDYQAPSVGGVGTFSTVGLIVGNTISMDISAIFNSAIGLGWSSLGIRLQDAVNPPTGGGAWTFDSFRLTSTNESTNIPEPASLVVWSLLGAIAIVAGWRRRKVAKA